MFIEQQDKKGNITLKVSVENIGIQKQIYLASKYDAEKEGLDFAKYHSEKLKKYNILYGLGLGYHAKHLLKFLGNKNLLIFENRADVYSFAKSKGLYQEVERLEQVNIVCSEDEKEILNEIRKNLYEGVYFFTYTPSVYAIHETKSPDLKYALESLRFSKKSIQEKMIEKLKDNCSKNEELSDPSAEIFWEKHHNKPALLVAAGPSLENALPYMKKLKEKYLIFTVGRSLKALLNHQVIPDYIALLDGEDLTYEQFKGYEDLQVPLLYLSTASHKTVRHYLGPRYIFYNQQQEGQDLSSVVETDGSVATAVFSLLIKFGCNPIIFVGQDLGYVGSRSHHKDLYYEAEDNTMECRSLRKVEDVYGNYIDTTLGYLRWKRWFEKQIQKNRNITFYNASKGANIQGAQVIDEKELWNLV